MTDNLREHNFDGIQEYDNQLPRWWVYKFVICIIFGAAYFYWFVLADLGPNLYSEFKQDSLKIEATVAANAPVKKELTEEQLRAFVKDDARVKAGAAIFATRCMPCHGAEGQGIVGPNLTDNYWIHGGSMVSIVNTITNGVPEKGMVPWKAVLSEDEIHSAAAFVKSIKGKNVANPKPPQGTISED